MTPVVIDFGRIGGFGHGSSRDFESENNKAREKNCDPFLRRRLNTPPASLSMRRRR
jgi:hypothetical protein